MRGRGPTPSDVACGGTAGAVAAEAAPTLANVAFPLPGALAEGSRLRGPPGPTPNQSTDAPGAGIDAGASASGPCAAAVGIVALPEVATEASPRGPRRPRRLLRGTDPPPFASAQSRSSRRNSSGRRGPGGLRAGGGDSLLRTHESFWCLRRGGIGEVCIGLEERDRRQACHFAGRVVPTRGRRRRADKRAVLAARGTDDRVGELFRKNDGWRDSAPEIRQGQPRARAQRWLRATRLCGPQQPRRGPAAGC